MFKLDLELIELMEKVERKGYEIYVVGGFVRDLILKRKTRDLDLATSMPIKHLKNLLKTYEIKDYNEHFGSLKFELKTYEVEVTQFRRESDYKDSRHPDTVEFSDDFKEDVLRRDFTMNALYMNKKGEVFDPVLGMKDLKANVIKTVRDPKETFKEDALRIVRLFRFQAQLNFEVEFNTLNAALKELKRIQTLKAIQYKGEAIKILSSPGLQSLYKDHQEFLKELFPNAEFSKEVFIIKNSWEYKLLYMYSENDLDTLLKSWELSSKKRNYLLKLKRILNDYTKMPLKDLFIKHGSFMWFEMMTLFLNIDNNFVYRNKFLQILRENKTRTLLDLELKGQDLIDLKIPEALRNQVLMSLLFEHIWTNLENEKTKLIKQVEDYKYDIH